MPAVAAALDVTAERRGATAFDRAHGTPPRGGLRRAVPVTKSHAEVAEYVRHFQPDAGHATRASGGYEVRCGWHDGMQRLQRTGGGADLAGGDPQILRRGAQAAMTQQQLDGAQIGASLQQVNREGVAQRMRRDRLADPAPLPHLPAGVADAVRRDRLVRRLTREQPLPRDGYASNSP